jgi:hypothetical protein
LVEAGIGFAKWTWTRKSAKATSAAGGSDGAFVPLVTCERACLIPVKKICAAGKLAAKYSVVFFFENA